MREINKIAEGLFEKIRDRFEDVSLGDENAHATQNPENARFFNFDYVVDDHNYGNITLSVIDEISLKVYFSKNISSDLEGEDRQQWFSFLKELREFAKRNLLSFEPRDITRSTLKHRDIQQVSKADSTYDKNEVVGESRLYGTSRSSYENEGPVRLIIRHSGQVDPEKRGDRSRKIRTIYLENSEGERIKLPHNSLRYARAMARHVSEGGNIADEFGQHITEIAEECSKLKPFKAAMIRRVFEDEDTQDMVEAAFEYHSLLKDTLNKMSGRKGYNQCREQFVHTSTSYIPEEDFDANTIKERFVKRTYNERMDDALPIVYKAYNMKKSNKMAEAFESWANRLAEGTWALPESDDEIRKLIDLMKNPLPAGIDAENASSALYNLIGDDELFDELFNLAKDDPEQDIRPTVFVWLEDNHPELAEKVSAAIDDSEPVAEMSKTGDTPVNSMSRSELLDYLNVSPLEAQNMSNEELRAAAEEKSQDMTEGNTYGSYGAVYEMEYDEDQIESIQSAIIRRILGNVSQHSELIKRAGPEGVMNAARDVASFHAPVEELGSSDISIMVREVYNEVGVEFPEMNEADTSSKPLRKTASPGKKARDAKYYDYLARTLGEDYDAKAPSDSSSPLTYAQDKELAEGKMKEVDMDLIELSDAEFEEKYKMSKEDMKANLAEGQEKSQEVPLRSLKPGDIVDIIYVKNPENQEAFSTYNAKILKIDNEKIYFTDLNYPNQKFARVLSDFDNNFKILKSQDLDEAQGDDYVNRDEKMKRMGAKPLSTLDKLKMMPGQMKAMAQGKSEDDLVNYNKQFDEEIAQMRKIAGLK
jgi:hypothetical protein